jgi:hypothetical protein
LWQRTQYSSRSERPRETSVAEPAVDGCCGPTARTESPVPSSNASPTAHEVGGRLTPIYTSSTGVSSAYATQCRALCQHRHDRRTIGGLVAPLTNTAAFGRRCIPPRAALGFGSTRSNTAGMRTPRAWRDGRLDAQKMAHLFLSGSLLRERIGPNLEFHVLLPRPSSSL